MNNNKVEKEWVTFNSVLPLLKKKYKQYRLKIIKNNIHAEPLAEDENIKILIIDICAKINGIKFQTCNYPFCMIDRTNIDEVIMMFEEYYIIPILNGFNTYEEYNLCQLEKESS